MIRAQWLGVLITLAALVAGYSTPRVAFTKPGATDVERKRDETEGFQGTIGHNAGESVPGTLTVDRELFRNCLERRGYVPVR